MPGKYHVHLLTVYLLKLYVPPSNMVTKEDIRGWVSGSKLLMPLGDLKPINMASYPELSVKKCYAEFSQRDELKKYFPDSFHKGRQCQKAYFWNIIHSKCT